MALRRALHVRCERDDPAPLTCIKIINLALFGALKFALLKLAQKRPKFRFNLVWLVTTLYWNKTLSNRPNQPSLLQGSAVTLATAVTILNPHG